MAGCLPLSTVVDNTGPQAKIAGQVGGIILPHHLLVSAYIDKFYAELAATNSYDRIVILSPNHFGYGFNFVQTNTVVADGLTADLPWVEDLDKAGTARIEPKFFGREHGVYVHYPFIKKYFPAAKIVPIIIKKDTPCEKVDSLVTELLQLEKSDPGKTLYLASLDFSHYSSEKLSIANDNRTVEWLKTPLSADLCTQSRDMSVSLDNRVADAVAIDSAGVIYAMRKLMDERLMDGKTPLQFHFWARTSAAAIISGLRDADNTSHIFGYYSS